MGLGFTAWLWGNALGAPIMGMIFDQTGSYAGGWVMCGVAMILGGLAATLVARVDRMFPDRCKRPPPGEESSMAAAGPADKAADLLRALEHFVRAADLQEYRRLLAL